MIVVVGSVAYRPAEGGRDDALAGRAAAVARIAAAGGGDVQLVAKIGDDGAGDAVVMALGRERVGHAALLRDPARPTPIVTVAIAEPADDVEAASALVEGAGPRVDEAALSVLPVEADARPSLESADLELALRYLPEVRVVVVAEPVAAELAEAIAGGASFFGAQIVAVVEGRAVPDALVGATVFEAPVEDDDDAFARVVASYAIALDAGRDPRDAFAAAVADAGWERTEAD